MKQVVINADDLGISQSTNAAILRALRDGVLSSASLMSNMPAFDHAVQTVVRDPIEPGIGAHLCLTSGRPVAEPRQIPMLLDASGLLKHSFGSLLGACSLPGKRRTTLIEQIRIEWTAQLDRHRAADVSLGHLDSHQHVHAIPALFRLVEDLADRYSVPWVRRPRERRGGFSLQVNTLKRVVLNTLLARTRSASTASRSTDGFFGVQDSGAVTSSALSRIAGELRPGVTEIITHPGHAREVAETCCSDEDLRFLKSSARDDEFAALCDDSVRAALHDAGCRIVRFRDIDTV